MWECYIRPTRRMHESGYRCFEVGYGVFDSGKNIKKIVLNKHSDVVHLYDLFGLHTRDINFHPRLDLIKDGYIRLLPSDRPFRWLVPVLSDAMLEAGTIDQGECEKLWKRGRRKGQYGN